MSFEKHVNRDRFLFHEEKTNLEALISVFQTSRNPAYLGLDFLFIFHLQKAIRVNGSNFLECSMRIQCRQDKFLLKSFTSDYRLFGLNLADHEKSDLFDQLHSIRLWGYSNCPNPFPVESFCSVLIGCEIT